MKYRFFTNTEKAWDAMYAAIQGAQHSIYWECYILLDDTPSHRFYSLLEEKARQGVLVKIVIDSFGSFREIAQIERLLKAPGAEVLYFNRLIPWWNPRRLRNWWFTRNHRKVLIVDERIGFLGGVNVGEAFRRWFDLHVRVEGMIVRRLARSFVRSYRICGGRDRKIAALRAAAQHPSLVVRMKMTYIGHISNRAGRMKLKKYYLEKFATAEQRITIITPYFMPHQWFLEGLMQAKRRGVMVEVLLPEDAKSWFITRANRVFACDAVRRGIRVLLLNAMNHAKAFLVDGKEGMIGSANIDANSFDNNWEASLVFQRRDMVERLERIVNRWKATAKEFHCESGRIGVRQWFFEGLIRILHPFM